MVTLSHLPVVRKAKRGKGVASNVCGRGNGRGLKGLKLERALLGAALLAVRGS